MWGYYGYVKIIYTYQIVIWWSVVVEVVAEVVLVAEVFKLVHNCKDGSMGHSGLIVKGPCVCCFFDFVKQPPFLLKISVSMPSCLCVKNPCLCVLR